MYDETFNNFFRESLKLSQYNAALTITGTIRSSSRGEIYQELGLEPYSNDRDTENCLFFKMIITIMKNLPSTSFS